MREGDMELSALAPTLIERLINWKPMPRMRMPWLPSPSIFLAGTAWRLNKCLA